MIQLALAALLLGACGDDANPAGPIDAGRLDAARPVDAAPIDVPACDPPAPGYGAHDPDAGIACGACHDGEFPVMGTIFVDPEGTAPLANATVRLDHAGGSFVARSAANGVFYAFGAPTTPTGVRASLCPDAVTMPSAPPSGDCNSCHGPGNRVHLP